MKIKRFVAPDMRAAIRMVREEQGPDAVILSNQRVAGGIEVVAATDYDEALVQQAARVRSASAESRNSARPAANEAPAASAEPTAPTRQPAAQKKVVWAQDPAIAGLRAELGQLRNSIEGQLRSLSYDVNMPSAGHAEALRDLIGIGLDPAIARGLLAGLPASGNAMQLRSQAMIHLSRRLPHAHSDSILYGGRVALIGPTGVGKTTTLAKLAARYAQSRSARDVALVTTDHYRIGAQEQLFTYGRLLGMPVHALRPGESLDEVLSRLQDYRLVLIDTAGMSPRDPRLAQQLHTLNGGGTVKNLLVLPASGQAEGLEDMAERFSSVPLAGCIFTKLDETSRLGGALSVAIRRQLSICYVCDGQRVPEDLHRVEPHRLIIHAMRTHASRGPAQPVPLSTPPQEVAHASA